MTKPDDSAMAHLAALLHLRDAEEHLGTDPLRRREDCPEPGELIQFALGQASRESADRAERHAAECVYCRTALQSMRSALADEPLPEMPDDSDDPVGRWVMSGEPVARKPAAAAAPPAVEPPATNTGAETPLGLTRMASDPRLWPQLLAELRPWAPELLRRAGLDPDWAGDFLALVEAKLPGLGNERFTPMLDRWCEEFARSRGRAPAWRIATATLRDFEPLATRIVLSEQPGGEEEKVARLREEGLKRQTLTRAELLNLPAPEGADASWASEQLSRWYFEAGSRLRRARELFEVA
jgi:hypothetical protein